MENASKALIIAGSILVSIVIITLGVMIVSNVTDTINNNSNLSAQEIASYNSNYEGYVGQKSGTQVKTLLGLIDSHNRAQADNDDSRLIAVAALGSFSFGTGGAPKGVRTTGTSGDDFSANDLGSDDKAAAGLLKNVIKAGNSYYVEFGKDPNSGLITMCYLTQK